MNDRESSPNDEQIDEEFTVLPLEDQFEASDLKADYQQYKEEESRHRKIRTALGGLAVGVYGAPFMYEWQHHAFHFTGKQAAGLALAATASHISADHFKRLSLTAKHSAKSSAINIQAIFDRNNQSAPEWVTAAASRKIR